MWFSFCYHLWNSVTEDNYDTAVTLLKEKFGSRESIMEALYAKLHISQHPLVSLILSNIHIIVTK